MIFKANLPHNTWINLNDLFYALMLPSGNDAAVVISDNLGGFLYLMKHYEEAEILDILYNREEFRSELSDIKFPTSYFLKEMNKNSDRLKLC